MTVRSFFGGLLLTVGFMIVTLSGLCSLYFIFNALMLLFVEPMVAIQLFGLILVAGGIPFVFGWFLLTSGIRLRIPPE